MLGLLGAWIDTTFRVEAVAEEVAEEVKDVAEEVVEARQVPLSPVSSHPDRRYVGVRRGPFG